MKANLASHWIVFSFYLFDICYACVYVCLCVSIFYESLLTCILQDFETHVDIPETYAIDELGKHSFTVSSLPIKFRFFPPPILGVMWYILSYNHFYKLLYMDDDDDNN